VQLRGADLAVKKRRDCPGDRGKKGEAAGKSGKKLAKNCLKA